MTLRVARYSIYIKFHKRTWYNLLLIHLDALWQYQAYSQIFSYNVFIFIILKSRTTETQICHLLEHSPMPNTASAEPGQSQESGTPSRAPTWLIGTQGLESPSATSQALRRKKLGHRNSNTECAVPNDSSTLTSTIYGADFGNSIEIPRLFRTGVNTKINILILI